MKISTANPRWLHLLLAAILGGQLAAADGEPPPFNALGRPNRNRPGPWDNDVLVYRAARDGTVDRLATFPRAGVPTATRLPDDRLVVAHQHFPADNDADFDKVAVRFSSDEGHTWTPPEVIRVEGLPEGMRFPFDPTLVPLPDGRVRLYFTSLNGRRFEEDRPAIFSAVSSNSINFVFETGARFAVEDRPVIDCAVTWHAGVFQLFAPDNGTGANPDAAQREPGELAREGVAYHATSADGLNFTRQPDVRLDGGRRWLGNVQSDGGVVRFFGTGGPDGVWTAASTNAQSWTVDPNFPRILGADPGAVKLKDGGWLLAVTGPPRERRPQGAAGGEAQRQPVPPLMGALDANSDGVIDEREMNNAAAALRTLDRNGDNRLTPEELRPVRPEGGRGEDPFVPRRPGGH